MTKVQCSWPARNTLSRRVAICSVALTALATPGVAGSDEILGEILGPGDTISITVFQNPDLSIQARISAQGTIVFPLLGKITLSGQTPVGAGEQIARELEEGRFLVRPQVSVSLVEVRSRQVSVLGHVARPGQYPLDGTDLKLTDVLALAGGISPTGDNTVTVMTTRDGKVSKLEIDVPGMYRSGDLSPNIELSAGDTIFVPSAPVFYVYGEVQSAGAYRLEPGMSVMNALSLGGGLTPRGTDRGLQIHRRMPDGTLRALDATLADPLEPNDVIYVKEAFF